MSSLKYFVICAVFVSAVSADDKLRLCVQDDIKHQQCYSVERDGSPIKCERIVDSTNCAIKIAEGKADFGIFTADELLLAHQFYPTGIQVVAELRNKDKLYDEYEFQSVAVVPKSYIPSTRGGFSSLIGSGFCHPGFSKNQLWNDHILKYFEQKVFGNVCRKDVTVAENEIINLRDFFHKGCRPGEWVADEEGDRQLKKNYPQLCELCDDRENCRYKNAIGHGHYGALDCLKSGRGQVAYASLHYVKDFFAENRSVMADFQFLCENGTVMPLDTTNPCVWYKQPWKVILAKEGKATQISDVLEQATKASTYAALSWENSLSAILYKGEDTPTIYHNYTSPMHYLSKAGNVKLPESNCGKTIRWCTVSRLETNKCNWTSAAALSLGIKPAISCVESSSVFQCFDKISNNNADIMTIDSNYGHLARRVYGLSPILFSETASEDNSFVVAAVRDTQRHRIMSWKDIENKKVCFPEYGGIAWISFINSARDYGVLPDSCKYPQIVAKLVRQACTPGFVEDNHSRTNQRPKLNTDNLNKLCELCPIQNNGEQCEANSNNLFYGDKGTLECLRTGGEVAFLEARNLKDFIANGTINATDYRVLCKNGTLADKPGFDVDPQCALSVTIDSEVVSRREIPGVELYDISAALMKIEDWLGYRGDAQRRAIQIYASFNDTANLLFKDSTRGLVSTNNTKLGAVDAYKRLFSHVDSCTNCAQSTIAVITLVIINFFTAKLI